MRYPHRSAFLTALALTAASAVALAVAHAAPLPPTNAPRGAQSAPRQFTATIEAAIRTATAARFATSGTLAAATMTALARGTAVLTSTATTTPTATTTLPPPFSTVDPCICLTPMPDSTECANAVATLHAGYRDAFASQTALARGTDTPTPTPSDTPTATPTVPTRTPTPLPTDEPTPTPRPTWTARVVIVTATPAPRWAVLLPMLVIRRR